MKNLIVGPSRARLHGGWVLKFSLLTLLANLAVACQLFDNSANSEHPSSPANEVQVEGSNPKSVVAMNSKNIDLTVAQLWARVDELENITLQQKERLALIEKGLMLGIVPDELKKKEWKNAKKTNSKEKLAEESVDGTTGAEQDSRDKKPLSPPPESQAKSKDLTAYRSMIQSAQSKFNSANYGQAISLYNEIGEKFDESLTEGSHHYWVGLGWYYLKEYQLSEQSLSQLVSHYPQSRWVPYARFYQAKIDQTRGLNNRAFEQMKKLLEEFGSQEIGEMARQEVQKMRENF